MTNDERQDARPDRGMKRRDVLALGVGLLALAPVGAYAADEDTADAIRKMFGDAASTEGRIAITLPPLAEFGNSVPLRVAVDSPMTQADHVKRVAVFANRNPRPLVATVMFSPASGRATFDTTMRLSGTQDVIVFAEMSDGSLWRLQRRVLVTVGACDSLQMRY